jgi:PhnB protein
MKWNTYLTFGGNCAEAFKYYERVLGGKIVAMMTHADMPPEARAQTPPSSKDLIMHVRLVAGDNVLMGSDAPPEHFQKPQGFSVSIQTDDPKEAERIFAALADNGRVTMPLQQTFWAVRFGMLVDRFGTPWMVNCERQQS